MDICSDRVTLRPLSHEQSEISQLIRIDKVINMVVTGNKYLFLMLNQVFRMLNLVIYRHFWRVIAVFVIMVMIVQLLLFILVRISTVQVDMAIVLVVGLLALWVKNRLRPWSDQMIILPHQDYWFLTLGFYSVDAVQGNLWLFVRRLLLL